MSNKFDPRTSRSNFENFGINFLLSYELEEADPIGNIGVSQISRVIHAWMVGLQREVAPAFSKALAWIDRALENGEVNRFGADPNTHQVTLHWAKALGTWMLTGDDDWAEWDLTRCFEEARWRFPQRPWPTNEIVHGGGLDDYMAFTVGAAPHAKVEFGPENEIYMAGIEMYERWTGRTGPIKLSGTPKPRDVGYALCRYNSCTQSFEKDELLLAARKMLRENLQEKWLGSGQYIRAATWLKIVHHQLGGVMDPLDCLLRAYDDMPDVARPDFV